MANYQITLRPLKPFLFGGDTTFGQIGDKENSSYLVKSMYFPQSTTILGMLKKEIMTQSGVLTRKIRGEWVDARDKQKAIELVGVEKFSFDTSGIQDYGAIKSISAIRLQKDSKPIFKMPNHSGISCKDGYLHGYNPKNSNIFNSYYMPIDNTYISEDEIFDKVSTVQNQKDKSSGEENALFKKVSLMLKNGFCFAFDAELDYELKSSFVYLGADRTPFEMSVKKQENLKAQFNFDKNLLILLGDAMIDGDIGLMCETAITSEVSFAYLTNKKGVQNSKRTSHNSFSKSKKYRLYEKGSIFFNPSAQLINALQNVNLQKIGLNLYTTTGEIK